MRPRPRGFTASSRFANVGIRCWMFCEWATFPPHFYTSSDHAARSVEIPAARGTQAPPSFNLPHVTWMNSFRRLFRGMRWSESDVRWDMHKWLWARACIFYLLISIVDDEPRCKAHRELHTNLLCAVFWVARCRRLEHLFASVLRLCPQHIQWVETSFARNALHMWTSCRNPWKVLHDRGPQA